MGHQKNQKGLYDVKKNKISIVKKWAHELEKRRRFHKSLIFHDR
jgi:hypothetical protein